VTGDSTSIADRMSIGAGPFAHCRRVQGTAATPRLRCRRPIGGLRGSAGSTGSTTRSQPPACSSELIEMRLAQVQFVASRAVVHSNRRHGLGAVTVKIAGQHDPCCLSHDTSVQRHTSDRLLARMQAARVPVGVRLGRRRSAVKPAATHDDADLRVETTFAQRPPARPGAAAPASLRKAPCVLLNGPRASSRSPIDRAYVLDRYAETRSGPPVGTCKPGGRPSGSSLPSGHT
jgi:hypothetical protein